MPMSKPSSSKRSRARFLGRVLAGAKTLYETKRYLIGIENAGPPVWRTLHSLTLPEITRTVIENRLETIKDESGTFTADRARAALSGLFAWAIKRRKTETNPVIGIEPATGADHAKRDRVLSDSELRTIWQALPTGDYGDIVRLLILYRSAFERDRGHDLGRVSNRA